MKRKLEFSVLNLVNDTPSEIIKLQRVVKGFVAIIAGLTYFKSTPDSTLLVGAIGYVLDELLACCNIKEVTDGNG